MNINQSAVRLIRCALLGRSVASHRTTLGRSVARLSTSAPRMTLDYYYDLISAPCRGPMMVAKAIGVDLNLKVRSYVFFCELLAIGIANIKMYFCEL